MMSQFNRRYLRLYVVCISRLYVVERFPSNSTGLEVILLFFLTLDVRPVLLSQPVFILILIIVLIKN